MSDTNSANFPTSIDDYQPPQNLSVPAGMNPPAAPTYSSVVDPVSTDVVPAADPMLASVAAPVVDPALVMPAQVVPAPVVSDGPEVEPVKPEADFTQAFAKSAQTTKANQPKWTSDTVVSSVNGQVSEYKMGKMERMIAGLDEPEEKKEEKPAISSEPATEPVTEPVIDKVETPTTGVPTSVPANAPNQSLDAQNIFVLLGVNDGSNEEKEAFLDELQEVIWEDFLAHDCELLLTDGEMAELKKLEAKGKTPEVQEEILIYLEKLIPDLEEMMLDKALELKEDMLMERIAGLREFYAQNATALQMVTEAEKATAEGRWADAASSLNSIK